MEVTKLKNEAVMWVLEKINKGLYKVEEGRLYCGEREVKTKDVYGYLVGSVRKNGVKKQYKVHRAIFAFYNGIDALNQCEVINHKDFDRTNNHPDNLEGMTSRENVHYSKLNGRYAIKLTEDDVRDIKKILDSGVSYSAIAARYNVFHTSIQAIKHGVSWRHITYEMEAN
jgi:hypothetical protein